MSCPSDFNTFLTFASFFMSIFAVSFGSITLIYSCKHHCQENENIIPSIFCNVCKREWIMNKASVTGCPICSNDNADEEENAEIGESLNEETETEKDYLYRLLSPFDLDENIENNLIQVCLSTEDGSTTEFDKKALFHKIISLLNWWFNEKDKYQEVENETKENEEIPQAKEEPEKDLISKKDE